jgi:hypothetical protein
VITGDVDFENVVKIIFLHLSTRRSGTDYTMFIKIPLGKENESTKTTRKDS